MDAIERQLELLLDAKPYEELVEFCDFTLSEQNEAALAKGVTQPATPADYKPVIKKTVTYIVAAVIINESGEVLMMQVRSDRRLVSVHRLPCKLRFRRQRVLVRANGIFLPAAWSPAKTSPRLSRERSWKRRDCTLSPPHCWR
jgi:hypothetical protein